MQTSATSATKAAGVAAVAARYGVRQREVLAFGDGNNDAALLAWAGLGVAMNHARPAAQAAAKIVAAAGDVETGLARAVEGVLAAAGLHAGRQTDPLDDSFADSPAISDHADEPALRLPSDRTKEHQGGRLALLGRHWPMLP